MFAEISRLVTNTPTDVAKRGISMGGHGVEAAN